MAQRERQVKPVHYFVGEEGKLEERLYAAERKVHDAIAEAADLWMKVVMKRWPHKPPGNFWVWGLPQILFDLLNSYQTEPAAVAAQAFLDGLDVGRFGSYRPQAEKAIAEAVTWEEGARLSDDEEPRESKPPHDERP